MARLLYLAWVILGLFGVVVGLVQNIADDLLLWSLSAISTILGLIAIVLLFKSPSNAWFKQCKKTSKISRKEPLIRQREEVLVTSEIPPMVEQPKAKKWMIASQLIAGLLLIPWFALSVFASMIGWPAVIEAEGGWDFLSVTFSLMLFYPIYAIVSVGVAWVLYFKRQHRWAARVTSVPLLLSILLFILWILAA